MEKRSILFAALLVLLVQPISALACTCIHGSLSKRFRKAEAIFFGRVADIEDVVPSSVQNYKEGLWVLEVKKSFKGASREMIAVDLDLSGLSGSCPFLMRLEPDVDYLIFAYGKDLKIRGECPDSRALRAEYDWTTEEINRLDNFCFRNRARFCPFE